MAARPFFLRMAPAQPRVFLLSSRWCTAAFVFTQRAKTFLATRSLDQPHLFMTVLVRVPLAVPLPECSLRPPLFATMLAVVAN